MIHILSVTPYIEKIVRGHLDQETAFHPEFFSYRLQSTGIQLGRYLEMLKYPCVVHSIVGKNAKSFIGYMSMIQPIEMKYQHEINTKLMDDEEYVEQYLEESDTLTETEFMLYKSVVNTKIAEKDVVVLAENSDQLGYHNLKDLYLEMERRSQFILCALQVKDLAILATKPCNVLILDVEDIYQHVSQKNNASEFDLIAYIQKTMMPLTKILVINIEGDKILVFHNNQVYQASSIVKDPIHGYYPAAILAGVISCLQNDGDLKYLLKETFSMSVTASLSSGLYVSNKETIDMAKQKINITKFL